MNVRNVRYEQIRNVAMMIIMTFRMFIGGWGPEAIKLNPHPACLFRLNVGTGWSSDFSPSPRIVGTAGLGLGLDHNCQTIADVFSSLLVSRHQITIFSHI